MKKKKIASIFFFLGFLTIAVVSFYFFTFQKHEPEPGKEEKGVIETIPSPDETATAFDIDEDENNSAVINEPEEEILLGENEDLSDIEPIEITGEICEDQCIDFNNEEEDFMYCLEICELADSEKPDDCKKLADITKDYCWKSQAVENIDDKLCDNISDPKIRQVCQTRIAENSE